MTEYLLEQGDTYAAIKSSLAAGDIVNGQGNSFSIWDARNKAGADGNPLIYKNGTVDGAGVTARGSQLSASNYTTIEDFVYTACTARLLDAANSADLILRRLIGQDSPASIYGMFMDTISNLDAYDISLLNAGYTGFALLDSAGSLERIRITESTNGLSVTGGSIHLRDATIGAIGDGLRIASSTFFNGYDIRIVLTNGSTGMSLNGAANSSIRKVSITGSAANDGIFFTTGANDNIVTDGVVDGVSGDGVAAYDSAGNTVLRTKVRNCGTEGETTTGDAFTSHDGCTGEKFHFNYSSGNLNTSHAHVSDSSGEIYHHTGVNDGGLATPTRAMLWLTGTGVWVAKNSVFYHQSEYLMGEVAATHNVTTGNNCYISPIPPTSSPFEIGDVGATWSEWVASTGEVASLYIHINGSRYDIYTAAAPSVISKTIYYCPIYTTGSLRAEPDNPLIGAAETLAGINTGSVTDCAGKKLLGGSPDIGCFGAQPDSGGGSALLIGAM